MRNLRGMLWLLVFAGCAPPPPPALAPQPAKPVDLFDSTIAVLSRWFYDTAFVRARLPPLRDEFRPAALAATDDSAELVVIRALLSRIAASHLALLSRDEYGDLLYELAGQRHVMFGMQVIVVNGRYFAAMVLTGGPAFVAGVREGDEIAAIDGRATAESPHLDLRDDDVFLPDDRDPPAYGLRLLSKPFLDLRVVRVPGETTSVHLWAGYYSALDATKVSTALMTVDGVRVGYIHWWYMSGKDLASNFRQALKTSLATSEALVLDLRGRGGTERTVQAVLQLLSPGNKRRFAGPIVVLVDRRTRSAKEELAYELRVRGLARLVGEPTAGAFIPAGFAKLNEQTVLMFPVFEEHPNRYISILEGHPIVPDVTAPWVGPYAAGRDSIMEAGIAEAVRLAHERTAFTRLTK